MIKRTISEKEKQIIYRLQLKPVGKLKKSSKQVISHMKKINFQPERQPNIFQDQISPGAMQNMGDDQDSPFLRRRKLFKSKKAHQNQGEIIFNLIQDPRESQFSYRKYLLIEKVLLILTIFSFFVFAINTQVDTLQSSLELGDDWQISKHVNMISSFMTIILIFVMLLRYISINQLEIDQKKFYCIRTYHGFISQIHRFLKQKQSVISFLIELMMLIPHPFFLFHETKVSLFESYDQTYIFHRLNDLLTILSLFRCYIILRSVINLTVYSTPRASRLCSNNQVDHSILYSVKCLLKQQPLRIIALGFAIQLGTLGFGLKLSEGFLIYNNPDLSPTGFQNYINCYWCIFITMATVGYGDYYPKTLPGRMIGLIAAASGIILTSLLIVSLSAYLTMQTNQLKSHLTLIRLQQQKKLQEQATQAMIQTMKMTRYLSSQERQPESKIRQIFTTLKYKIDLVKFRSRKIKSMVNNNNFIEQMNRLFELFKDNLQQSYENQVMLKESLNSINNQQKKQKKMRTIFLTQNMEQFIANPKA